MLPILIIYCLLPTNSLKILNTSINLIFNGVVNLNSIFYIFEFILDNFYHILSVLSFLKFSFFYYFLILSLVNFITLRFFNKSTVVFRYIDFKIIFIKIIYFFRKSLSYFFNLFNYRYFNLLNNRNFKWSPLFKKTSYFGLYNFSKNK